jgi:hypothetical protein
MRIAAVALAVLAAAGCGHASMSSGSAPRTTRANLEISVTVGGKDSPTKLWTLKCPSGGTLPNPAAACRKLAATDKPFAPVPKNVACTEVYGGPQVAQVSGTFEGKPVNARFSRTDGCQIARWNKVRFLFPGVS